MSHITQEQIFNFAKEAGFKFKNFNPPIIAVQHSNGSWISVSDELTAFANLVVAALAQPEPVSLTDERVRQIAGSVADDIWPGVGNVGWTDDDMKFYSAFAKAVLAAAKGGV